MRPLQVRHLAEQFQVMEAGAVEIAVMREHARDLDVNPRIVTKAKESIAELFANWESLWPRSCAIWRTPGLRLVIARDSGLDYLTGAEYASQHWFVASERGNLVARVEPSSGTHDPDALSGTSLYPAAPELTPFLAEPYRYFVSLGIPSLGFADDSCLQEPMDLPGNHPLLEDVVRNVPGNRDCEFDELFDRLGTDKLRCYLVASSGDCLFYLEDSGRSDLYVLNWHVPREFARLGDPERELDSYVADALSGALAFRDG
jgi:hypothetical protein